MTSVEGDTRKPKLAEGTEMVLCPSVEARIFYSPSSAFLRVSPYEKITMDREITRWRRGS